VAIDDDEALARARAWAGEVHPHAEHLERARHWLLVMQPDADAALQIAAITHDIERAFPAPEDPPEAGNPLSPIYNQWHQERSARVTEQWLREQGARRELVDRVGALVRVHEFGGPDGGDELQAADSLAFLEVQIPLFERLVANGSIDRDVAVRKLRWMYERIQIPRARPIAEPMLEAGLARIADESSYRPVGETQERS
jgi:hypothetical protein